MRNSFIIKYKKQNILYISLLALLCLSSTLINYIPDGYIIAQGDHSASVNIRNHFMDMYIWSNLSSGNGGVGDASYLLHHSFYYLLDLIGFSDSQKMNIKYFLFYFLSSLFMYQSIGIFFKSEVSSFSKFVVAVFYGFNPTTLLFAVSTGAYLGYLDAYCFFPIIWVLFIKGLLEKNNWFLATSVILFFLSLSGFKNPAYLLLELLLLFGSIMFCKVIKLITFKQILLGVAVLLTCLFSIAFIVITNILLFIDVTHGNLPNVPISNTEVVKEWIIGCSKSTLYLFNFYGWEGLSKVLNYGYFTQGCYDLLAFYPSIFFALSLLVPSKYIKNKKDHIWLLFFAGMFLFIVFGTAKTQLSKGISLFIFTLPIMNSFKSWDKFLIFQPFFAGMVIYIFIKYFIIKSKGKKIKYLMCFFIISTTLVSASPFFTGKLHRNISMNFQWGYQFDTMVRTPEYYREIANVVNADKDIFKILYMPYSMHTGVGWSGYLKWRFVGADYTHRYFNNPVLLPIDDSVNFSYAKDIHLKCNEARYPFINMVRIRGIRYLVVNRDVMDIYIKSFHEFFKDIRKNFIFVKTFGNLDLYKLVPNKELPVIYGTDNIQIRNLEEFRGKS